MCKTFINYVIVGRELVTITQPWLASIAVMKISNAEIAVPTRFGPSSGQKATRLTLAAMAMGAVGLTGCLGSSGTASKASAASDVSKLANVPLVVYSAQGYDKAVTAAFSAKYHIKVELDDNSTGPLLTQIEASKNNPNWGLLWVDGSTAFAALDQQNLLLKGYEPNVQFNSLGTSNVPTDKSFVPTGVTAMAPLVYNKTKIAQPPTSWNALLASKWKGKVGMNDPSQSGPTYPFIAGMMNLLGGVKQGEAYFSKLKANGLVINPTNGPTLAALASSQIDIALVQSSAGVGAVMADKSLAIKYLNPVTTLPGCIGIDSKASKKEQAEAKQFIGYVLSPAGQKVMQSGDPTGDSLYYPVVRGTNPLPGLPSLSGVRTQVINPYTWGSREAAVNSWFTANIVQ